MVLAEKEARALCDLMLARVTAPDASVQIESRDVGHLRFAGNAFTTSGAVEEITATATVWFDGRPGSASGSEVDAASLARLVAEAERISRLAPVDPEYISTLGPQKYEPAAGWFESTALSPAERARRAAEAIAAGEKAGVTVAGFMQSRAQATARATKNGNFLFERSTLAGVSMTARTAAGESSGYFFRNHPDAAKLDSARISAEAIRRAVEGRHPRELPPGEYAVVLEPQAVADLFRMLIGSFDARGAEEGRNAFAGAGGTKLGTKVFDERFALVSDPWHADLPASPATSEGIPAAPLHMVRAGVLENLAVRRFWGRKSGKAPTPGPVNWILRGSGQLASIAEMIAATARGLLVGRFWYLRMVDPRAALVTGLTRDGLWLIEKGRVVAPVRNFRFNQGVLDMLAPGNVAAVGAAERVGGGESASSAYLMPALALRRFNFTSVSEAV